MQNENLQKEIEAYINQDLSKAERIAFEQRMTQDPLLRNEVELQSAIISSIQSNGRLALKQSLEATNVSLLSTAINEAVRYGVAALATGAIVAGTYFAFTNINAPGSANEKATTEEVTVVHPEMDATETSMMSGTGMLPEGPVVKETTLPAASKKRAVVKTSTAKEYSTNKVQPKTEAATLIAADEQADAELAMPAAAGVNKVPGGSIGFNEKAYGPKSTPEVEIIAGDRLNHKYTYHNSKLILIGDFANKIYELIELKVDGGKMLFIYYNTKFYPIEDGTVEPASLKEINDEILLQELVNLRKKNVE